jgi:hypothetical protein
VVAGLLIFSCIALVPISIVVKQQFTIYNEIEFDTREAAPIRPSVRHESRPRPRPDIQEGLEHLLFGAEEVKVKELKLIQTDEESYKNGMILNGIGNASDLSDSFTN